MSFPEDIQDIILYYVGDDRLFYLAKNKKKYLFLIEFKTPEIY